MSIAGWSTLPAWRECGMEPPVEHPATRKRKDLKAYSLRPADFMHELDGIIEALAAVVEKTEGR